MSLFEMEQEDINKDDTLNIDPISLFRETKQELSEKLLKKGGDGDSTDVPLTFIEYLTDNLKAEFDETLVNNGDKKLFIRSLNKIFAIFSSTKADSVDKIKNIIRIAVKAVIKLWREQN